MNDVDAVRVAAGLPDDPTAQDRADEALGNALVGVVQKYLARVSDHWDVDLFFETYGRPPRDGSPWSQAIIDGLIFRKDISDADRQEIIDDSRSRAVNALLAEG
jgi:hypothetical protein